MKVNTVSISLIKLMLWLYAAYFKQLVNLEAYPGKSKEIAIKFSVNIEHTKSFTLNIQNRRVLKLSRSLFSSRERKDINLSTFSFDEKKS